LSLPAGVILLQLIIFNKAQRDCRGRGAIIKTPETTLRLLNLCPCVDLDLSPAVFLREARGTIYKPLQPLSFKLLRADLQLLAPDLIITNKIILIEPQVDLISSAEGHPLSSNLKLDEAVAAAVSADRL